MQDSVHLTDAHEYDKESGQCATALDDAGGSCSSSSLVHTQGESGAEPGVGEAHSLSDKSLNEPATNPPKDYERLVMPKPIGFGDKVSIGTFAWMNAVYDWADRVGMDVIIVRDIGEWCAIVRLSDSVGPFQVEVPVIQPIHPRNKGKELYEPFCDRIAKHISNAIQRAREARIVAYTKRRPAGIHKDEQIDLEELIAQAKERAA
jgi:hypothetical protein